MKRSAQVALLFGGLATAGTGAYAVMQANPECRPQRPLAQGTTAPGLAAPMPGAQAASPQTDPCQSSGRRWSSFSSSGDNDRSRGRPIWGGSNTASGRTSASASGVGVPATRTSFGGFGRIGSAFSRAS